MSRFFVSGKPEPKGSVQTFCPRNCRGNSHPNVVPDNDRLEAWTQRIILLARHYCRPMIRGPVALTCVFRHTRPKCHYRTGKSTSHLLRAKAPREHFVKPDADKLLRAVMDALTKAAAWEDDARACSTASRKEYVNPGDTRGEGVWILLVPPEASK